MSHGARGTLKSSREAQNKERIKHVEDEGMHGKGFGAAKGNNGKERLGARANS